MSDDVLVLKRIFFCILIRWKQIKLFHNSESKKMERNYIKNLRPCHFWINLKCLHILNANTCCCSCCRVTTPSLWAFFHEYGDGDKQLLNSQLTQKGSPPVKEGFEKNYWEPILRHTATYLNATYFDLLFSEDRQSSFFKHEKSSETFSVFRLFF